MMLSDSLQFAAKLDVSSSAPNFNWILNQSDYENYNWYNPNFDNVNTQRLEVEAESEVYGQVKCVTDPKLTIMLTSDLKELLKELLPIAW